MSTALILMLSSPFIAKFGTNYSAEEGEIATIAAIVLESSLRVQSLDEQIATLQRSIDKLIQERNALQAYADEHKGFLSPIRRVPRDIIQEIFIACLPIHRNCVMSAAEAPISLTRICSAWREISLSTAVLWSRVHIVEPTLTYSAGLRDPLLVAMFNEKMAQRLEATELWLRRSGQCALSVSVRCAARGHTPSQISTPSPIIQALVPHASRLRHISFINPPLLPELSEADLPLLKSVTFRDTFFSELPASAGLSVFPSVFCAPQLCRVCFVDGTFHPLELPLRWDRLSELSFLGRLSQAPSITAQTAIEILSRCTVLRELRLWVDGEPEGAGSAAGDAMSKLKHSYLQLLDVECRSILSLTLTQLCGRLVLPDLRTLMLTGYSSSDDGISGIPFDSFLARSPHLERVRVYVEMFTQATLSAFIRALPPSTRELEVYPTSIPWSLSPTSIDREILLLLAPSSSVPDLGTSTGGSCPFLEELLLPYSSSFSDEDLKYFINSKMANGASTSLRRVSAQFRRRRQVDILPDLQQFIESGLEVELGYEPDWEGPQEMPQFSPWDGLDDTPPL